MAGVARRAEGSVVMEEHPCDMRRLEIRGEGVRLFVCDDEPDGTARLSVVDAGGRGVTAYVHPREALHLAVWLLTFVQTRMAR